MIETVEELIEIYSLDKEIKDTSPIYRDFAAKMFAIYSLMKTRINLLQLPKDDVKQDIKNTVENKPTEIRSAESKPAENRPVRNELNDKSANLFGTANNKPVSEVNKTTAQNNTPSEKEIIKENSTTNNKISERRAGINIVQKSFAYGSSADGKDCTAINNININFGNCD